MKVDLSGSLLLCTANTSPTPPSGSETKQFITLTFLPTGVDRWEGHLDPTDAWLHFEVWSLRGDVRWSGQWVS